MAASDDRLDLASADGLRELSAAELRARLCAAVDRVQALEGERCALEEVRDSLVAKQRDLTRQLEPLRGETRQLEQELAAAQQRVAELEQEIATAETDGRLLERRSARALASARELAREADAIADELSDESVVVSADEVTAVEVGESIQRLGHKLSFQGRKFAQRDTPEDEQSEVEALLDEITGGGGR